MPQFRVLCASRTGTPAVMWSDGRERFWDDGASAQAYAKRLNRLDGQKYMVKPVIDMNWRLRENHRFSHGEYKNPIWVNDSWWRDNAGIWANHFLHLSTERIGYVAYTESDERGSLDKQTVTKPGAYLKRYFETVLRRYDISIDRIVARFNAAVLPRRLFVLTSAEDIERIYALAPPESCMGNETYRRSQGYKWASPFPATRCYGAGDLAIAYITDEIDDGGPASDPADHDTGRITARALVWPAKHTHSRCYGDVAKMTSALNAAGFRFEAPLGAKLLRVKHKGAFVMPYLDAGARSGGGSLGAIDRETHLEIAVQDRRNYHGSNTNGMSTGIGGRDVVTCEECGDPEDDIAEVYFDNGDRSMSLCGGCRNVRRCEYGGDLHDLDTTDFVEMDDGQFWSRHRFDEYGITCAKTGARIPRESAVRVYSDPGDRYYEWWGRGAAEEETATCRYSDLRYRKYDMVNHAGFGGWIHKKFVILCTECLHDAIEGDTAHFGVGRSRRVVCVECHDTLCQRAAERRARREASATAEAENPF
jgi:hypothetical protein